MDRCQSDPQGAITAMRTLLESVLKHLLELCGVAYGEHEDIPRLGYLIMERLQIAPGQQSNPAFRRIFGGCSSVIDGLASLRNQLGDAHGAGRESEIPAIHHAFYAVNLAGATALFLLQTWEAGQSPDNIHEESPTQTRPG